MSKTGRWRLSQGSKMYGHLGSTMKLCVVCAHLVMSTSPWVSDSLQPHGQQSASLLCPWNFPGKNVGVGHHFLLQGFFPTQGSNLHLLQGQVDFFFLPLSHLGSLKLCVNGTQNSWRYPGDPESLEFRTGHCNKLWRNPKTTSISSSFCSNFLCSAPVGESLAQINRTR